MSSEEPTQPPTAGTPEPKKCSPAQRKDLELFFCPTPHACDAFSRLLVDKLDAAGYTCVRPPADTDTSSLARAVAHADAVVVVLTADSIADALFARTLLYALTSLHKIIIPFSPHPYAELGRLLRSHEVGLVLADAFLFLVAPDLSDWESRHMESKLVKKLGLVEASKKGPDAHSRHRGLGGLTAPLDLPRGQGSFIAIYSHKNSFSRVGSAVVGLPDPLEVTAALVAAGFTEVQTALAKEPSSNGQDAPSPAPWDAVDDVPVADVVLLFVSNELAAEPWCDATLATLQMQGNARVVPVVVGEGWAWMNSHLGLRIAGDLFIDLQKPHRYEARLVELAARVRRLAKTAARPRKQAPERQEKVEIPQRPQQAPRSKLAVFVDQAWLDGRETALTVQRLLNANEHTATSEPEIQVYIDTDTIKHTIYEELANLMQNEIDLYLAVMTPQFLLRPKPMGTLRYVLRNLGKPVLLLLVGVSESVLREGPLGDLMGNVLFMSWDASDESGSIQSLRTAIISHVAALARSPVTALIASGRQPSGEIQVMVSYCWSNSLLAFKARDVQQCVGRVVDPRAVARDLAACGFRVWLDVEQLGQDGLFADIRKGIQASCVVVTCVSDEYALSVNCVRELYLAVGTKPLVPLVVGGGSQLWRSGRLGLMLSQCDSATLPIDCHPGTNTGAYEDAFPRLVDAIQLAAKGGG